MVNLNELVLIKHSFNSTESEIQTLSCWKYKSYSKKWQSTWRWKWYFIFCFFVWFSRLQAYVCKYAVVHFCILFFSNFFSGNCVLMLIFNDVIFIVLFSVIQLYWNILQMNKKSSAIAFHWSFIYYVFAQYIIYAAVCCTLVFYVYV